ncbi:MAG: hypothetical protein AAFQ51_17490 [Pseudomonadota bacterium]
MSQMLTVFGTYVAGRVPALQIIDRRVGRAVSKAKLDQIPKPFVCRYVGLSIDARPSFQEKVKLTLGCLAIVHRWAPSDSLRSLPMIIIGKWRAAPRLVGRRIGAAE